MTYIIQLVDVKLCEHSKLVLTEEEAYKVSAWTRLYKAINHYATEARESRKNESLDDACQRIASEEVPAGVTIYQFLWTFHYEVVSQDGKVCLPPGLSITYLFSE